MAQQVIPLAYQPRDAFIPFHNRTQRFSLLACHRRAGKTRAVVADMTVRALRTNKSEAFYAYIAPTYGQAKNIAWKFIKNEIKGIPGTKISESETSVRLPNGATIRCFGVDNPDALRGLYFDGIVCDEFGEWQGRAYTEVIRPALADRQGWCVFIGTPKGPTNKFAEMRNKAAASGGKWFYLELKASESGILPQSELDEMKLDMDEEEIAQELEVSFTAANRGSFYGKQMIDVERRGQIRLGDEAKALYDLNEPVCVSHDVGRNDAWAMWFWQVVNGEIRFIDYFCESGYDAEEIIEVLQNKPYRYESWWVPHDALHKTARSHKSILDVFRENDAPARKVPNPDGGNGIVHGVSAVRKVLRTYPIVFDGDRCAEGLQAIRNYSRKWDADNKVLSAAAKHDHWSNGADSFRYACLSIKPTDLDLSVERFATRMSRVAGNASQIVVQKPDFVNTSPTLRDLWHARDQQLRAQRSAGRPRI